ncbi:MAG: class 3 adenylate cyclase, partial [Gammaproteobacteria bacterium]
MTDVNTWLHSLGLGQYTESFAENAIEWDQLIELDHDILKEIGVKAAGHRMRILAATKDLPSAAAPQVPSPSKVADSVVPVFDAAPAAEAERRQLTVMFADLADSTQLSQRFDPEDLRDINRAYQDAAKAAIEQYGGYVARYMGDGVLAYFGYPQAHEDDAERAVRAALQMVSSVRKLATSVTLAVRVGIASGAVVVGDIIGEGASQESAVVGETPNLAARLQTLAMSNSVVIGDQTRRLTAGAFIYADLGEHSLKGFGGLKQVWEVRGETLAASRFEALRGGELATFIGREHDLAMLLERWGRAVGEEGQVVLVCGEAGMGKSRVTNALRKQLADSPHIWLRHQCSPHHTNSALYPFIVQMERAAGLLTSDDDKDKLRKLEDFLSRGKVPTDTETICLLAALLSISTSARFEPLALSPAEHKTRTFAALVGQLAGLADELPVLWVFEDAHWADPTTRDLLAQIIDELHDLRVLAVITTRPEFRPAWDGMVQVSTLPLGRLSKDQSRALVASLTDGKALPELVLEQIIAKTDGVPLFVEELTKTVLESDLLVDNADRYELAGRFSSLAIPSTLQDSLMARLDRLGEAKRVAQTAAAIGREFTRDLLLRVMAEDNVSVERALTQLVDSALLFARGVAPSDRYVFKHALVQEVALDSMLRTSRQAVHQRIAQVLESEYPTISMNEPERLAHHFGEAKQAERAIDYWHKAGRRAAERSAYVETVSHLSNALRLLATLADTEARDEQELALQGALGPALMAVEGFASDAVEQTYTRARQLCERTGKTDQLFQTMYGLFRLHLIRAQYDSAMSLAQELLLQAEAEDDRALRITAHRAIGNSALWLGDIAEAQLHLARGASLYNRGTDRGLALLYGDDPGVDCLIYLSLAQWSIGQADQGLASRAQAVALARELSHPFSLGRALGFSCLVHCIRREFSAAAEEAEELLALSTQHGLVIWKSIAQVMLGISLSVNGESAPGLAMFNLGLTNFQATGARVVTRLLPALLADALARTGNVHAAVEALKIAAQADDNTVFWDAEHHRIRGDLDGQLNVADSTIEASYQQALVISRRQGARAFELRAATALARFWCARGKRTQA